MKYTLIKLLTAVNTTIATSGVYDYIDRGIDRYGFPIVCVVICFGYIWYTQRCYREDFNALHELHAQEVKSLTTALIQNTEVIRSLKDLMLELSETEMKKGDM